MQINADANRIATVPLVKPVAAEPPQTPASTRSGSGSSGDVVEISAQARSLAAGAEQGPLAGTPGPALAVPNAGAGAREVGEAPGKTATDEQELRAPERAVAQRQEGSQAAQGRVNLLV